jgi:hypothetical protein
MGLLQRRDAYRWMRLSMGLSHAEAHIGSLNQEQCEALIKLVYTHFPNLRSRYSLIAWGEWDE